MEKIISYITKNFITVLGISFLTGTTLTTSAVGMMKIANNFEKSKLEVPEVRELETSVSTSPSPTTSKAPSVGKTSSRPVGSIPTQSAPPPSEQGSAASAVQANVTNSGGCIVTLFGKQYDVANLRSTHSGGNIFNCGTDMTAIYQGKHGINLARMDKYLVTSGGTTGSNASSPQNQQPSSTHEVDEKEDHRGEEEVKNEEEEKEMHNEDEKEEMETHLETFLQQLIRLVMI